MLGMDFFDDGNFVWSSGMERNLKMQGMENIKERNGYATNS